VEIHKPKPWHGWREFLKEYLIIVVGVLTALAAEQVVETLHWRHLVGEQRAALNSNIQRNDFAMHARMILEPCVQRRFAELDEIFRRHREGRPLGVVGRISRPGYAMGGTQLWDVGLSDGSLAHMRLDEKRLYVRAFSAWNTFHATHSDERSAWIALQGLDHPEDLSADDWSGLRRVVEQARDADREMQTGLGATEWRSAMRSLKLKELPGAEGILKIEKVADFCKPMLKG
jgi:hypothetical protein